MGGETCTFDLTAGRSLSSEQRSCDTGTQEIMYNSLLAVTPGLERDPIIGWVVLGHKVFLKVLLEQN